MRPSPHGKTLKRKSVGPALATTPRLAAPAERAVALNYALLGVALAVAVFSIVVFARGYSPILFADSWKVLIEYKDAGFSFSPSSLLSFHNEHRPFMARIPILVDQIWAGGRGWLPFGLIFLTQVTHAWLLWWIASKQPSFQHRQRLLIIALAIFCCFSPAQMENFIWSFQTAFLLNFLFASAAVAAVAAQKQNPSAHWSAVVAACACLAPLCLASGVLVWWLVVLMALAVRLPRKWVALYAVAGILTIILYLHGYAPQDEHNKPLDALSQPFQILLYVGYFLAASWKWWTIPFGELLAVIASTMMLWRIGQMFRKQTHNPWEAVPPALMLFSLGTGFLAALGRIKNGIEQAGSSRYQTPALLFWFMAALLVVAVLPKRYETAFGLFLMAAMVSIFPASKGIDGLVTGRRLAWDRGGAAWVSGVDDRPVMDGMFAGNQLPLRESYLQRRLGWFSVSPGSELGSVVGVGRIQVSNFCQGIFHRDASFLDKQWPGIRLRGFARVRSTGEEIREFVTATSDRLVIGVGNNGIAYAALKSDKEPLVVYGLLDQHKVCAILTD